MNKKFKLLIVAIIFILIEIFIFNINSFKTIGKKQVCVNKENIVLNDIEKIDDKYLIKSDCASIEIKNIDMPIETIYADFYETKSINTKIEEAEKMEDIKIGISFKLYYTDESTAGYETNHTMNRRDITVVPTYERSKYIPCNFIGNVRNLKIEFNDMENQEIIINNIILNKQIPFSLYNSLIRFSIMFLLYCSIVYLFNDKWMNQYNNEDDIKTIKVKNCIKIFFMILMMMIFYNNVCDNKIFLVNDDYYCTSFIDSLSEGKFYLNEKPSQELISLKNPYDFSQRKDIESLWDVVLYNNKYYIYFGILPALLILLPIKILFNCYINGVVVLLLFNILSIIISCDLIFLIIKKWFKTIPNNLTCLFCIFFLFSSKMLWITARPEFYEMIISVAYFFIISGIFFIIKSNLITKDENLNYKYLSLGCVFLALSVACRPTALFVSLLILPSLIVLLYNAIKNYKTNKKELFKFIYCCALPYIIVGVFLMIYNYIRFNNPFDFGASHQLTVTDMHYMKFSISRITIGIYSFLFSVPIIIPEFPFIYSNDILPYYQGMYYNGAIGNGVFTMGILPFVLFLLPYLYKHIKTYNKKMLNFILSCIVIGLLLLCFTASFAGNAGRYAMDFAWLFNIATILILCFIYEKIIDNDVAKSIYLRIILFCVLISSTMSYFMAFTGENGLMAVFNIKRFYDLKYLFSFWM